MAIKIVPVENALLAKTIRTTTFLQSALKQLNNRVVVVVVMVVMVVVVVVYKYTRRSTTFRTNGSPHKQHEFRDDNRKFNLNNIAVPIVTNHSVLANAINPPNTAKYEP